MFTGIHTVIFYVKDISRAKDFYINTLGLTLDRDDGYYVALKTSLDDDTIFALNAEGKEGQFSGHQTVILKTNNVEESYEKLKNKVNIVFPLTIQPWGKTFIFTDPDGNKIEVLE